MQGFKPRRKLKLKSHKDRTKRIIIIAIAAIVAVLLLAIGIAAMVFLNQQAEYEKSINKIYLAKAPDKSEYFVGDEINYDGLEIMVLLNNYETYAINVADCEITGFNSSVPTDECVVTVKYKGFKTSFTVKVKEEPEPTPDPVNITFQTMPKTEYKVGEPISVDGGVILVEYSDGSTKTVSMILSYLVEKPSLDKARQYEITVKYKENGVAVFTTYTITVN